ncbi:spc25 isoform 1-T1 [Glossina fuscipes fuscipes]
MNKCDVVKRFKRMEYEECQIVKLEANIVGKCKKYFQNFAAIKRILNEKLYALSIYKEHVKNLELYNRELEKLVEEKQANVTKKQEQIQELESELEEQEKKDLENMMKMDHVRQSKELTETYINLQALPDHVQGVTLKDTVEGKEWEHFCISTAEHTEKEIEGVLTKLIQDQSAYKEQWRKLILGELPEHNETT